MYKLLRSFLFLFDPEWVHYFSMNGLKFLCSVPGVKKLIATSFKPHPNGSSGTIQGGKPYEFLSIQFQNRVGLGAGFDKNAKYLNELETLGFGFVEIGTVTPLPQAGNDKPRLFRLPKDKALINRMGFNNDGVAAIAKRLASWRLEAEQQASIQPRGVAGKQRLIIGGNIGKNKMTANEDAWKDYETCFTALYDYVDYFVVNVSSPNTPGLRALQEKDALHKILTNLQMQNAKFNTSTGSGPKPILLKIAPDLNSEQIDDVVDLAMEIKLDGLVASNTTLSREGLLTPDSRLTTIGAGGLSGLPLKERNTEIVKYIHQRSNGQIPIIASGGIFTGADAKEKIDAGASLVQVWTGFIYEGPGIVKNICKLLSK